MIISNNSTLLIILAYAITLVMSAANSSRADTLTTTDGDKLSGTTQSFRSDVIVFQSPMSNSPLLIRSNSLDEIKFPHTNEQKPLHTELITLTNGDSLPCNITSMNQGQLKLSTWYAGDMKVHRSNIRSILFGIEERKVIFLGNEPPTRWTSHGGDWALTNDTEYKGTGYLAQEVQLPKDGRCKFDLSWQQRPNFVFRFCANEGTNRNAVQTKQNTYEFVLNSEGIQIYRYPDQKTGPSRLMSLNAIDESLKTSLKNKKINIELQFIRSENLLVLRIDSQLKGYFEDPLPVPEGNYIIFNNRSSQPADCVISNIEVTSYTNNAQPRFDPENKAATKTDILNDSEGDSISGKFVSIQGDNSDQLVVTLDIKHSKEQVQVPERRLSALSFARDENADTTSTGNHILTLQGGGKLHVNLPKLTSSHMLVEHSILGPLQISRKSLQSIKNNQQSNHSE